MSKERVSLEYFRDMMGWDYPTLVTLMLEFIEERGVARTFHNFLEDKADLELRRAVHDAEDLDDLIITDTGPVKKVE